ncbi:MAG: helix-turn-helix domain-containing protein [Burkholderiaceae bacterium]
MQPGAHHRYLPAPLARQDRIAHARQRLLTDRVPGPTSLIEPWIARSWERCLALGHTPSQRVGFDAVSSADLGRAREDNRVPTLAARATMRNLGRALADTRYFAILTNRDGVVIDSCGPIDRSDRRAELITRVGVDLSEPSVGTTAIGAALTDLQPVWLHRGEHFFVDTSVYSCAGVPLFGHQGHCVGMLDLTGVEVPERPELLHLAMQSARHIENALTVQRPHTVLLRLTWPGQPIGTETDALIGLDDDGLVRTCNRAARDMLPPLQGSAGAMPPLPHAGELFALPFEMLFDACRRAAGPIEVPLWSGLHVQLEAHRAGIANARPTHTAGTGSAQADGAPARGPRRLREIETALICQTVDETGGNVTEAAKRLGVSRATVYRRLGLRGA